MKQKCKRKQQKRSTQNDEHAREMKGKKFEFDQAGGTTKNFIFSIARTNKSKKYKTQKSKS